MKKKFFAVALATTMALSTAMTASAADYTKDSVTLAADSYEEIDNPIAGKNYSEVTIEYTINWNADAPRNGWDGIFAFYNPDTTGRVSFQTAPYLCFNSGDGSTGYIDLKMDAWCTNNCEAGKDYTFKYVIKADSITVTCDGKEVEGFAEVGRDAEGKSGTGYQAVLDAVNSYSKFTLGCGLTKSCYWNTEPCKITNLTISGSADTPAPEKETPAPEKDTTPAPEKDTTPKTGDAAPVVALAAVAVLASAAVVVSRKKVTE